MKDVAVDFINSKMIPLFGEVVKAVFIQIILFFLTVIVRRIIEKIRLSKVDYDISGIWINAHDNFENTKVLEIVKFRQSANEISLTIQQFKEKSYKIFKGKGIICGDEITVYYYDTNKMSMQIGVMVLSIQGDGKGWYWIEGEYLERIDSSLQKGKGNTYKLYRQELKIMEKISIWCHRHPEGKFRVVDNLIHKYRRKGTISGF